VTQRLPSESRILAAVDLGSNSFHMVLARLSHGQLKVIDRLREMVRLAAGSEQQPVALECLARFGERIRDMHVDSVRVVGTNTLRKLGRTSAFVRGAESTLGHPLEIISGIEEARLIFLGVSHTSPAVDGNQLVVDIGGGSTEIISGNGFEPEAMESLHVGCVGLSNDFFGRGKLTRKRFEQARVAARLEVQPAKPRFNRTSPMRVIGASGTIRAARAVLAAIAGTATEITVKGVEDLIERMIKVGRLDQLKLPGLSEQRKPVFPGGLAILIEVMTMLEIDVMNVSDGALREGILYDMVGRLTNEDARVRTVRSMEGRFNVDVAQADRVESTVMSLMDQVSGTWRIDEPLDRQLLSWAARLHEIGLHIAHSHYQAHGAYLLEYADMPGFPTGEQQILARLVGAHRSKLGPKSFAGVPRSAGRRVRRLAVLLRLAVLFNRSRTDVALSEITCSARGRRISIGVSDAWPALNPLTWADLQRERDYLADAGIEMTVNGSTPSVAV
jgi:exopolyphosphatase/guanosine-5'-triphosphate,3'-diphosphate pyrophosphatase